MAGKQEDLAQTLDGELAPLSLADRLSLIESRYSSAVFTTSLGPEDQAIAQAISSSDADIRIVTLQTGRLFAETLALLEETQRRLGLAIEEFHPDPQAVGTYVAQHGLNGFYDSVEARHICCQIRKIEPLQRALAGAGGWITGLRRSQSQHRESTPFAEWSTEHGLMKFNPIADWSSDHLASEIKRLDIPVNPLHARGYASVGCDPCTRAIKPGEPERAGRWWWEHDDSRECGLHMPDTDTQTGVSVGEANSSGAIASHG